jgi:hypothetical protein
VKLTVAQLVYNSSSSCNPIFYCRVNNSQQLDPILSQMYPLHAFTTYNTIFQYNIMLPSTSCSPHCFLNVMIFKYSPKGKWLFLEKTNSRSADLKTSRILWKPTVHYRVHKSPQLISVMFDMNQDNEVTFCNRTKN